MSLGGQRAAPEGRAKERGGRRGAGAARVLLGVVREVSVEAHARRESKGQVGSDADFTYTVVGFRGSGPVAFETALGAVFIEGIIFMAIAALGLRGYIVQAIPKPQP